MGEWAQSLACCGLRHSSHTGLAEHDRTKYLRRVVPALSISARPCLTLCDALPMCVAVQLTGVLPCWDSFATEALKDRLDDDSWGMPALRRAGLHISVVWGAVLSLCCVVTLVPALLPKDTAVHIACDYVAVMLLLVVGAGVQLRTTRRFLTAHARAQQLVDAELGDADVGVSVVR